MALRPWPLGRLQARGVSCQLLADGYRNSTPEYQHSDVDMLSENLAVEWRSSVPSKCRTNTVESQKYLTESRYGEYGRWA
jgi:hypothetical protein